MPKLRRRQRLDGTGLRARSYTPSIAAREIDGHLLRTEHQVTAWYRLSPQRWSFRSDSARERVIDAIAGQYAALQGRWLHLRVTHRPYPVSEWARAHLANSTDRPSDVDGALDFDDYLIGEQQQLHGRSMAEKDVYLGVQMQTRTLLDRAVQTAAPLLRRVLPDAVDAELTALDAEIEHMDQVIASAGLAGRPATASDMRWLLARSCTLGLPAPTVPTHGAQQWATEDLAALDDAAAMEQEPYAPTVTVRGRTGEHAGLTRAVAVLSVGHMHGLDIPERHAPWAQTADVLPVPVEWSARIYVRRPSEVDAELRKQSGKARSQQRHYVDEHGLDAPEALERQLAVASGIEDELASGAAGRYARVTSWWRAAVGGSSDRDALRRAQELVDAYSPQITMEHPEAQHAMAREFIPGEPLASTAYRRRGSVLWAASAVPQATADVGDRRGILLGETCTATRRPVAWDPWMAQEIRDASGLTAMVAGLGAGKSFLGGGTVYKTLRAGAHWTVLDPSGPLSALCELPELRPYSRVINLLHAQPGILNPYRVVPEPVEENYDDPVALEQERRHAERTRRQLVRDVLTNVLPVEIGRSAETRAVIMEAVRAVGGRPDAHPGLVIDALQHVDEQHQKHANIVWRYLDELREGLALLIPDTAEADPYKHTRDDRLTVLSMAGLTLPKDGVSREYWTDAEALGIELLNLAAWLTQRSVYERPKDERKGVWIDEAFFLSEVTTGRVLMNRFARDSRKWNVRVLLSSQIPADFLRIQDFPSLVDSVFVGRLDDEATQADALRLLKVPTGVGYEPVIGDLGGQHTSTSTSTSTEPDRSPRQFIFGDGAGGVERIRNDFGGPHLQHLRDALDTTPGQHQRRRPSPNTVPASEPDPVDEPATTWRGDLDEDHTDLGAVAGEGASAAPERGQV